MDAEAKAADVRNPSLPGADELLRRRLSGQAARVSSPILNAKRGSRPALSSHQRRLWFLHHLLPDSAAYNIAVSYRFEGQLDVGAVERSLAFILDRHEVLRTRFAVADGEPFQQIEPPGEFVLELADATGIQHGDDYARSLIRDIRDTPFDLQQGPLFRAKLIKLSAEQHILGMVIHHSIFDRESLEIFNDELTAAYAAICAGTRPEIDPLPVQYADFAAWEQSVSHRRDAAAHLAFWEERLAGAEFVLALPTDHPRPAAPSWRAGSAEISIPPETAYGLRNLAADRGTTTFMVCLAAYHAVLARYAGVDDIMVGIPVDQRSERALERMIGFFANSLPVRLKMPANLGFSDLVGQAREAVLEAYDHSAVPFSDIVEKVSPGREVNRNPIMQVWFDLASTAKPGGGDILQLADVRTSHFGAGTIRTRFDFEVHLTGSQDGAIRGQLLYAKELFEHGTAQRFCRHYKNFLAAAVANPKQCIWQIPVFDPTEFSMIIDRWGSSDDDYAE